jgi:nucleotide-binding universal stress UspA family protein
MPFAESTVRFGEMIAELFDSESTLLTVTKQETKSDAEKRLDQASELLEEPAGDKRIAFGEPTREILTEAERSRYGLIVVGAREARSFIGNLLGSVSTRVAHKARACVLVVPVHPPQLKRILICSAGKDQDEHVIAVGAYLARQAGSRTTLLHVTPPVPSMYTGLDAMEERLTELLQSDTPLAEHLRDSARYLADEQVDAELKLRRGVASDEILREARIGNYDLIVIGSGPLGGSPRRIVMADVTGDVVDRTPCPLLIVRDGCFLK